MSRQNKIIKIIAKILIYLSSPFFFIWYVWLDIYIYLKEFWFAIQVWIKNIENHEFKD